MALYLLIFESIGTSELIMIGIIALIFLGPRKLPQLARTIGKTMADFRSTTNEFKSTWEREVNFDEEEQALKTGTLPKKAVSRTGSPSGAVSVTTAPEINEIDKEKFDDIVRERAVDPAQTASEEEQTEETDLLSDKRNWL